MNLKCWMVIHQEKTTKVLYHKVFLTRELADAYSSELSTVTNEAEWIEVRMFDVHTEESVIMTPVQEDLYWDSVHNLQKVNYHEDIF